MIHETEYVITKVQNVGRRSFRPYSVQYKYLSQLHGAGSSPVWYGSYETRAEAIAVAESLGRRVNRWIDAESMVDNYGQLVIE